jgi:hypothetical protein
MAYSKETYTTPPDDNLFVPETVTQIEAEAGTEVDVRSWSPERVKQAIDALAAAYPPADAAKIAHLAVTQAVNLDTLESDTATNTLKAAYPPAAAAKLAHLIVTAATDLDDLRRSVPKAFGRFSTQVSPAIYANSKNFATVTRTGVGQYAVTFTTAMAGSTYTVIPGYEDSTATIQTIAYGSTTTAGFNIGIRDSSNALSDLSESCNFTVFEY